ncbi:unnamed protein product [Polarella glacialis]|uniref:Uncharacterized protein n=1 Tax=Polarella glacialis TaxID=89957 RepID=A0A813FKV8_POLGL|nr:unnamed protein product [Polarella glacialis]CAE8644730.1 unnamed protein product [Polarella glacialis]
MNGGLEGFMSAEDDWDEREDFTVEVDDHAEDVLEVVTIEDLEDFFPTVYGITLSTSSRTTEVVWVSRVDDKVLACFPGKALTGRRVSATGPLLARGAATASGSSRDSVEEEAPGCTMKVGLAFLTLDAMTLSLPLGLAAQDPDLLKFTSAAGEEFWPWRYSVLTAAEKFAGEGGSTDPAPRRASVAGAADAAGPGLQQIVDGGPRRSALKASSKKPPPLPPPSLGGAGGPAMREAEQGGLSQADLGILAKIVQGGQATKSKLQARPMTEAQLEEEAQDEAEVLEEQAAPTMAAALVKLTEVLAAMQSRSSRSSLEETLDGASLSSLGGFGGGGGEGLSVGKKNLRPLLHKALREQPEYFSKYMEKALRDAVRDYVAPSTSTRETALGGRIPARTYLQTKSRIAGHRPTQFWSWQVAGALEALTDGKPEERKARLLLLLAAGEQLCLDGGSMLLAQELVVEEIPPYESFQPQEGAGSLAQPWSALLNPSWASIHLQHLQETESWTER